MTGAMSGWANAGGSLAPSIILAPGHAISMHRVHEKLAAFDALSMPQVLAVAKSTWAGVWKYNASVDKERFGSEEVFGRYKKAQARKDWSESDRLFLDALRVDRMEYSRFLDAEETARAFTAWLCGTALASDYAYRWIDPPEIESCAGGTFESKVEADGTRRGFKALTANPGLWFDEREIKMKVPVGGAMRKNIRCVQYTVMHRDLKENEERVCDPKSAEYASEAEIRVSDGTPIPLGTEFFVSPDARIDRELAKKVGTRYRITRLDG